MVFSSASPAATVPCSHYYPVRAHFDLPKSPLPINQELIETFARYFQIPVQPGHKVRVSVKKDAAGNVRQIHMDEVDKSGVRVTNESVITDKGCYFILSVRTTKDELLDTSHIKGGYGIYYLPFYGEDGKSAPASADPHMVFGVDAARADIESLRAGPDNNKLLLLTREGQSHMLTVIDRDSMAQLQKIEIIEGVSNEALDDLYVYEDFAVAMFSDGRFTVLAMRSDGLYDRRFTASLDEYDELRKVFCFDVAMDYDGKRLAAAAFQNTYDSCGFYLAVYDENGLAYLGKYDHSLDAGPEGGRYRCLPADVDPLTLTWGG